MMDRLSLGSVIRIEVSNFSEEFLIMGSDLNAGGSLNTASAGKQGSLLLLDERAVDGWLRVASGLVRGGQHDGTSC